MTKNTHKSLFTPVVLPTWLKLPLQVVNLSAKEIPVGGEALALIEVILSNAKFIVEFLRLVQTNQVLKNLIQIDFQSGPRGVQTQFEELWSLVPPNEYQYYCDVVPQVYGDLQTAICDWIETIPVFGALASVAIKTAGGFDLMNSIYEGLPVESRDLFEHPDDLFDMVDLVRNQIQYSLNFPDKKKNIKGGNWITSGITSGITSITNMGSSQLLSVAKKNISQMTQKARLLSGPIMAGLNAVGADQLVADKVMKYLDKVLVPSVQGAVKSLKIIFPLYFSLLCLVEKCKAEGDVINLKQ
jgi:hypothetical protein